MLTALFFFGIINYILVLCVIYITPHLHVVKDSQNFEIKKRFWIKKDLGVLSVGSKWLSFFIIKIVWLKEPFNLIFCKIDCLWCNNCLNLKIFY
jgi:hypothetical protein